MKKYALAIIAVSLGLFLNAFTPVKKSQKVPGPELIWYYINGSNQIDTANPINPGDAVDEAHLESVYLTCLGEGAPCARGFLPVDLPTSPTDDGEMDAEKTAP